MVTFARWNGDTIWILGQTLELFVEAPKKVDGCGWWMTMDDGLVAGGFNFFWQVI
jgi:hypothetical protein